MKVSKPFPWGIVTASVVLGALLLGLLFYAFTNQGAGVYNEDDQFGDALRIGEDLSRNHVAGSVEYPDYPSVPPMGGDHSGVPQQCAVYDEPVAAEHVVHSLEHGAAWVTYRPDLPEDQVDRLRELVENDRYRLLSPLPGQDAPIVLTSWARQLEVDSADDPMVERFLDAYTNGRLTPERGAACAGTTSTGTTPIDGPPAPGSMPQPGAGDAPAEDAPAQEPAPEEPAGEQQPAGEPSPAG